MMKNLSAVIVGSHSARQLKTPVPLLPFGDTTVIGRTVAAYLEAGFDEIIVSLGQRDGNVREALTPLGGKVQVLVAPRVEAGEGEHGIGYLIRQGVEQLSTGSKALKGSAGRSR